MHNNQRRTTRRALLAVGVVALISNAVPNLAAQNTFAVQAEGAWIRWLPANLPAAGYVTLNNSADKPVVLIGVKSADYGGIALHQTRNEGGVSKMVSVGKVVIPAHGSTAFQPGSYHIMLMKAKRPIVPGDTVPITLLFEGGDSFSVNFEVRKTDTGNSGGMSGMDMNGGHNTKD